jgi:hypothetical protein
MRRRCRAAGLLGGILSLAALSNGNASAPKTSGSARLDHARALGAKRHRNFAETQDPDDPNPNQLRLDRVGLR